METADKEGERGVYVSSRKASPRAHHMGLQGMLKLQVRVGRETAALATTGLPECVSCDIDVPGQNAPERVHVEDLLGPARIDNAGFWSIRGILVRGVEVNPLLR